jgi:tetratricopeptide (TPR) repeat protein
MLSASVNRSMPLLACLALAIGSAAQAQTPDASPLQAPPDATGRLIESATVCHSDHPDAVNAYNEGRRLADAGDSAGAMAQYQTAIALDANFCDAYDNLGQLHRASGDLSTAITMYRTSLLIQPANPVALQNLALALMLSNEWGEATEQYRALVALDPLNAEGFYGLGYLLIETERSAEAVPQLQRAAELYAAQSSPLVSDAHLLLALAYAYLGQCDQAVTYTRGLDLAAFPVGVVDGIRVLCPSVITQP